jgi:Glutamine amidotransferases class-II
MISQFAKQGSRRLGTVAARRGRSSFLALASKKNRGRLLLARGSSLLQQPQQPPGFFYYTTERIVELRSGKNQKISPIPTLYDAKNETENCGVGLIASLKSIPSRKIVEQADEMLVRMAHRGGCGCDPASGDGSGT